MVWAATSGLLSKLAFLQTFRTRTRVLFSDRYLLMTNTGVTLGLSALGDFLQQRYEIACHNQDGWDRTRTRNILLSSVVLCPPIHYWYLYLDRFLPGRTFTTVMKKVFLDQLVISPVCILSFLGITGYMEGMTPQGIVQDLRTKGLALLKAEWIIWPPAQTVQFWLLPTRYRVLYDNTVCLIVDYYYYHVKYSRGWSGNRDRDVLEESCETSTETEIYLSSKQSVSEREVVVSEKDRLRYHKRLYISHAFFM